MSGLSVEDEWRLAEGPAPGVGYKWGWNAETGEAVVWATLGPGDGRPGHPEFLPAAWGRELNLAGGDRLGWARRFSAEEAQSGGSELVVVVVYYGGELPDAVLEWFRREFPDAVVRVNRADG